jgi:serine phosphatase RsbU (regulator of sigma subunit)
MIGDEGGARELERLRAVHELGIEVARLRRFGEVLEVIARFVRESLGFQACFWLADDRDAGFYTPAAAAGLSRDGFAGLRGLRIYRTDPLASRLAAEGAMTVFEGAETTPLHELARAVALRNVIAVRIEAEVDVDRRTMLAILVVGDDGTAACPSAGALAALQMLAPVAGRALEACVLRRMVAEERQIRRNQERELDALMDALERRQTEIARDLAQARAFQQSMLGAPAIPGVDVDIVYRPMESVGGDLYDLAVVDRSLVVLVADATGHGVRAALATMFIRSEYEAIKRSGRDPAATLALLNDRIAGRYHTLDLRFTAACAAFDLETGVLRHASAADPGGFVLARGDLLPLETGGPFLGIEEGVAYPQWERRLAPGDALYLFSDGISEAWNEAGETFGDERTEAAIRAAAAEGRRASESVCRALEQFMGRRRAQVDDLTFVGVRWFAGLA